MDTRLRNVSRNTKHKTIAFILTVIFITIGVLQMQYLAYTGREFESLFVEKYKDSDNFYYNEVLPAINEMLYLANNKDKIVKLPQNLKYYYYIRVGETVLTNSPDKNREFFDQFNMALFMYENGLWTFGEETDKRNPHPYYYNIDENSIIYLAFPDEYIDAKQDNWENSRKSMMPFVAMISACFVLALALIIYLAIVTGRKPNDDRLHMWRIDRLYMEIQAIVFGTILAIWFDVGAYLFKYNSGLTHTLGLNQIYSLIFFGIMTIVMVTLMELLFLSMIRKLKAKILWKHSIIYTIYFKIKDFLKSFFDGRKFEEFPLTKTLFYRQLAFIVVSFILIIFTFLFFMFPPFMIIPPIIEVGIIYWYVKYNNQTFEEINKGFDESLKEQMKSERTKIELITNVSHDLKTPLTSIISYIDLLSKEEDLSETARDYVNILSEKSYRLKNIVSDLFDLAKSTSGDINLHMEKLDLKKLIEQTLGDMEDDIEKSGLYIRTKLPDEPIYIISDGKRLYRVFQNLIDNALKYSLKGTRIYIDLMETKGKAIATIKNIAGYEMDFTAEEILQRFNRGDKARTSDGSGLGLSIAESFTKVCGGDFRVDIDGDLFKVTTIFNVEK